MALALTPLAALPAAAGQYRLLRIDGVELKWGAPVLGTGAEVSYGFATVAQTFPDAINCGELAPMAAIAGVWQDDPARLAGIARSAFAMWSHAAGIVFRPARAGEDPDILIGTQGRPLRVAFANVWHGQGTGIAPLTHATICFNPKVAWNAGPGPAGLGSYDLATVLAHEIGHAIGLDHPGATGALMGYSNQGEIDRLMPGDIAGAVALYGPAKD